MGCERHERFWTDQTCLNPNRGQTSLRTAKSLPREAYLAFVKGRRVLHLAQSFCPTPWGGTRAWVFIGDCDQARSRRFETVGGAHAPVPIAANLNGALEDGIWLTVDTAARAVNRVFIL